MSYGRAKNRNFYLLLIISLIIATAVISAGIVYLNNKKKEKKLLPAVVPDTKDLEIFKNAMHAVISFVSMEQIGCEFISIEDPACYACLIEDYDPGWNTYEFHKFFEGILAAITSLSPKAMELAANWKIHCFLCQAFLQKETPIEKHYELINKMFKETNVVIYPWGSNNHRIYIELLKHETGFYRIRAFDLGTTSKAIREGYRPIEFDNLSETDFDGHISNFIYSNNMLLTTELLKQILGLNEAECAACLPEYGQKTGNCVVKNLLAAMQQDAIDRYGEREGISVFSELYVAILKSCLEKAKANVLPYLISQLPTFDEFCKNVEASQIAFTGTSRTQLQPIAELYEEVRAASVAPHLSKQKNCHLTTLPPASAVPFADNSLTERDTANRNSLLRREKLAHEKGLKREVDLSRARLADHPEGYEIMSTRALAAHFPELGNSIFDYHNIICEAASNKIKFMNKSTGWYICYDRHGRYSTVHDNTDKYVALDGSRDRNGTKREFHFSNTTREETSAAP